MKTDPTGVVIIAPPSQCLSLAALRRFRPDRAGPDAVLIVNPELSVEEARAVIVAALERLEGVNDNPSD